MAARNPWILPVAILMMIGVLAAAVFGGAATTLRIGPRPQAANILRVPGSYGTIQAAIDAANPGDIIQVGPGTYTESILLNKGVSLLATSFDESNPANNTTILDGSNGRATILIPAGLGQVPSIHGFVIRNSKDGVEAHSQVNLEDNYFYGSEISVEYVTGGGGVNQNNVYFNSANDAVHVDDMTAPLLLDSNRFLYAGDDAIEIDFPGNVAPVSAVELDVFDNMLIGSSQDGIKLVDYATNPRDTNRHVVVAGNLIANNRRAGIGFMHSGNTNEDYSGADSAEAVRVYNNTFYGNDYGISGGDNVVAFNNIIANTTSRGAWRVQGAPGTNSVIAYTLFFGNRVDTDQTLLGPGNIFGQDPLFVAPPNAGPDGAWGTVDDDFRGLLLRAGSPAIDKGITQYKTASGESVPPTPLTGWVGAAPDLGWREFGASFFATTSTPQVTVTAAPVGTATGMAANTATATSAATVAATGTANPALTLTPGLPTTTGTPPSPTPGPSGTPGPTTTGTVPLVIQSIAPTSVNRGMQVMLTITGSGFQTGATVNFEGLSEAPPQVLAVNVVNDTTMQVSILATDDARAVDAWDVRVTNPDGTTARLVGAFTVMP